MRAFVAIKVPGHPALERAHGSFGSLGGSVKAVAASNMHITLKFIGETSIPVQDLLMALETASAEHPPFVLRPTGAGAFPNWSRPSVIWIGFGESEIAAGLVRSIDKALGEGFSIEPENRPFSPHLTLARVKGPSPLEEMRKRAESTLSALLSDDYAIPVSSVHLMSSTLTPKGPVYEEAGRVVLRG